MWTEKGNKDLDQETDGDVGSRDAGEPGTSPRDNERSFNTNLSARHQRLHILRAKNGHGIVAIRRDAIATVNFDPGASWNEGNV